MKNIAEKTKAFQDEISKELDENPEELQEQIESLYGRVTVADFMTYMHVYMGALGLKLDDLPEKHKGYLNEIQAQIEIQYGETLLNNLETPG